MALNKNIKYTNQITQDEHDDTANVEVKKSGEYGWDANNLEWKRIAVDVNGQQTVSIDTTGTNLVVESTPLAQENLLDGVNTGISNLSGDVQSVASTQTDGSQKTQIVDGDGDVVSINEFGELMTASGGHISAENSSTTPLDGDEVFTGASVEILDAAAIIVNVKASHASATDGLQIQFSPDGTNWDNDDRYTIPAATGKTFSAQPAGRYMRVVYTNGSTLQTYFRLETIIKHTAIKSSSHRVQDTILDDDDAELVESVLKLRTAQNNYVSGSATNNGNFKVSLEEYNGEVKTGGLPVKDVFGVNNIDEASATVTYIGSENSEADWYIKKIDTSSGTVFSHATEVNNGGYTTYSSAWTARASLTYGNFSTAF